MRSSASSWWATSCRRVEVAAVACRAAGPTTSAAATVGAPLHRADRVEVAGEVVGADHGHHPPRSPSNAWATASTSAAVERQARERQAREHRARELHGRASAAELVEVAAALGQPPEFLGDVAGEHRAA